MSSKIVEKIKNLIELAYDAPDDEEGQTALLLAQRLMVKHNLSLTDIDASQRIENIGGSVGLTEYRMVWWREKLAVILGKNFRCQVIRKRNFQEGTTQMIFFGYASDTELCTKVYEATLLYLDYRLQRLYRTVITKNYREYKKSYLLGFLEGLDQRFTAQTESSQEYALMVQVPAEVLEEQDKRMGKLKSRHLKMPTMEIDQVAYFEGFEHGKQAKLMPEELVG